jgi:hypothetical protein
MIHRTKLAVVFAAAAMLAIAGCSKDKGGSAAAGSAMSYMPSNASIVGGFSVSKVRDSKAFGKFKEQILGGMPRELREVQEKCGMDFVKDVDNIVVGVNVEQEGGVFAITGSFGQDKLLECLKTQEADTTATKDGDFVTYKSGSKEAHLLWPSGNTVVASDQSEKSLDDFKKSVGGGLKDNKEVMALVDSADKSAALWAAGKIPSEMAQGAGALGAVPSAFHVSVNIGDGIDAKIGLRFASDDEAKKASDQANTLLKQFKEGPQGAMFGAYMKDLSIGADGKDIIVKIKLSGEQMDSLSGMAGMFMR